MNKIRYILRNLKASFWFFPLCIILLGMFAAIVFLYIDSKEPEIKDEYIFKLIFSGSSDSARSVLSVIAGAVMTVAGTVFSITLVVLQLASSQFGPRLLVNFMYKRINQVVLGVYVSTFLYCLVILNAVKGRESFTFVPNLSVLFAIFLTIVSIILLIVYIHQVSISIQPSKIISDIYKETEYKIRQIFPFQEDKKPFHTPTLLDVEDEKNTYSTIYLIESNKDGYLQYIEIDSLLKYANDHDYLIDIQFRPGEYIVNKVSIAKVYSRKMIENEDELNSYIQRTFNYSNKRTTFQDAEFAIHQIVEVASKALSPGINDPYTALNCIDNLASIMCLLARATFPSEYITDEKGALRLIVKILTFEGAMDAAFNQIRQYGGNSPAVLIRLMEVFVTIQPFTTDKQRFQTVLKHADLVLETGKKLFQNDGDFNDLRERYSQLKSFY